MEVIVLEGVITTPAEVIVLKEVITTQAEVIVPEEVITTPAEVIILVVAEVTTPAAATILVVVTVVTVTTRRLVGAVNTEVGPEVIDRVTGNSDHTKCTPSLLRAAAQAQAPGTTTIAGRGAAGGGAGVAAELTELSERIGKQFTR